MRVGVDEDFLNRSRLWMMFEHQIGQRDVKRHKAFRQWRLGIRGNLSIGNVAESVADRCNHAPAGGAKAWVKAEDDQPIFSIMSSGTS